ncbi:inositol-tetrakisphosphate 1-kinase 2 [Phtheirospermum japonicum]|uniref:Inositol-tetrakisphosphate 1-kinase 2 n=1 Tax=Phtheirospermum japonicum TaxID=374723 RepID=A0A830CSH9_9LAMI|nr:inositol-tetrakisphosphate 1-kinase 2 [Phtheirospermum japonicum]
MGGEIAYGKNEEREEIGEEKMVAAQRRYTPAAVGGVFPPVMKVVVVGYALTSKKIKSFLQPKFERLARKKGILFVPIDQNRPLSDQGPFDIVLHKLSGKEWRRVLEFLPLLKDYRNAHPEVTVLDPPDAIQQVYNRQSMLQDVADLNLSDVYGKVGVPKQLVIKKDPSSIPGAVNKAGLRLPIVAKPLVAKSHELSLAYDEFSLQKLEPPLVLQEFINHGGVLFKVYIVGEAIKVLRRFSLPDVSKRELTKNAGVYRFPRVSCAAASADEADLDPCVAELPPRPLLERLAKELRRRLGLRLFNLDIIREHGTRDNYYVIDINYFPAKRGKFGNANPDMHGFALEGKGRSTPYAGYVVSKAIDRHGINPKSWFSEGLLLFYVLFSLSLRMHGVHFVFAYLNGVVVLAGLGRTTRPL